MDSYFFNKFEELKEEYLKIARQIFDLLGKSSMLNDYSDEIEELMSDLEKKHDEFNEFEHKIPNSDKKDFYEKYISFLNATNKKIKSNIKNYQEDSNMLNDYSDEIEICKKINHDNNQAISRFEQKIININNNSNQNTNNNSHTIYIHNHLSQNVQLTINNILSKLDKELDKDEPDKTLVQEFIDEFINVSADAIPFGNVLKKLLTKRNKIN